MNTIQKSCLAACLTITACVGTMNASDYFLPDSFKELPEVPFFAFQNPLKTTVAYINHNGPGSATRISSQPFIHTTPEKTGEDRLQRIEVATDTNKKARATKARKRKKIASKSKKRKVTWAKRPTQKLVTPSPEKRGRAALTLVALATTPRENGRTTRKTKLKAQLNLPGLCKKAK